MRGAASAADVLGWAWRAAGVPTIILPRWPADEHASAMLKSIYVSFFQGEETAESAVRAAASEIRAVEATRAPYYWAAWQVVGR
jgi:CHAT domain-containing protein